MADEDDCDKDADLDYSDAGLAVVGDCSTLAGDG